jgi:isoquinoline 1-oxidoreductase alpha subunit
MRIRLPGRLSDIDADPHKPLLWFVRDALGLVGTTDGCRQALCGACTIQFDGEPARLLKGTTDGVQRRGSVAYGQHKKRVRLP